MREFIFGFSDMYACVNVFVLLSVLHLPIYDECNPQEGESNQSAYGFSL